MAPVNGEDIVSKRFESNLIKQNEALYMQNKINYQNTMDTIRMTYGPFNQEEVDLYVKSITTDSDGNPTINGFQKNLVFDMFYKYFRDVQSIYAINRIEYVELVITLKRILLSKNMILLPYILAGKVEKLVSRKNVNKKELMMIEASPSYPKIIEKYQNDNILKIIRGIIATIISSDFTIVDLDPELHGKSIEMIIPIIIEEVLVYILMC